MSRPWSRARLIQQLLVAWLLLLATGAATAVAAATTNVITVDTTRPLYIDAAQTKLLTWRGWMAHATLDLEWRMPPGFVGPHPPWEAPVLDLVAEAGFNRLHVNLWPGLENTTDYYAQFIAGTIDWSTAFVSLAKGVNDDNDPNHFDLPPGGAAASQWPGFQWTYLDTYMDAIVLPLRNRLARQGDRLWLDLLFVDFAGSVNPFQQTGTEYGELMLAAFTHLQAKYGFVPDGIRVRLEGDTQHFAGWDALAYADAIKAAGDRLAAAGWHPEFAAPSSEFMGPPRTPSALATLDAMVQLTGGGGHASWADVQPYLTDFDSHGYGGAHTLSNLAQMASQGAKYGLRTSMSEWLSLDYNIAFDDLVTGRMVSIEGLDLDGPGTGQGCGVVVHNRTTPTPLAFSPDLTDCSRRLRQVFKYVHFDAQEVFSESTLSALTPIAFVNPNGAPVVAVRSSVASGITFQVRGLPNGLYHQSWTTDSQIAHPGPDHRIPADGTVIAVTVPSQSRGVVTVYRDDTIIPTYTESVGPPATSTPTPPVTPPASATVSPLTVPGCVGDCNGDESVTVDELLTMVGLAVGASDGTPCDIGDANGDGEVTVDEILTAVDNALEGCASAGAR